jgi:uncharacterized RDD family membrane protein YckC
MSSTTGGVVPPGAPPAPVGRRVAASLVDAALTAVAAAPLWLAWAPAFAATVRAASASGSATVAQPAAPSGVLLAVGAVLLAAWGVAQWVWNGTRGWTVGRRLLGLRLVDVRTGRPVGLGRAFVRALIVALGSLACGVGQLVVLLSPLFDSTGRRRGWHDRVGEGVVVDVRGLVPARRVAAWGDGPVRADAAAWPAGATRPGAPAGEGPAWAGVPHPTASGDAVGADRASTDPTPSGPTRTRWSALAADRRLDAPDLVLPPLGAPGLGPDLDTRQIPVVPAAVVPAHPAAPVPLAPGPAAAAPAAGPAAPAPEPAGATWPPLTPATPVPGAAPAHAPGPAPAHVPGAGSAHVPGAAPAHEPGAVPAHEPRADVHPAASAGGPPVASAPAAVPAGPDARPSVAPASAADRAGPRGRPSPAAPSAEQTAWRDALGPVSGPVPTEPPTRTGRHAVVPGAPVHPDAAPPPAPSVPPAQGQAPGAPWQAPAPSPAPAVPPVPPPPAPHAASQPSVPPAAPLPPAPFPAAAPVPAVRAGWAVRLPDGTVADLGAPLLIGRNPDPQDGVRVVAVADPSRSVSKTHLMLGADEHGPWVVDRGSTNGTLVTLADGQRIVCLPDRRVRLADGSLVAFGDLALAVGLLA